MLDFIQQLSFSLNMWDQVISPVPMLLIGIFTGAIISGLLVYLILRKSFRRRQRELRFLNAANGVSNSVLNIVQMGVVAYTDKGTLLFNNQNCLKRLKVEELPQSFTEFVSTFIPDKNVAVQLQLYETDLQEQTALESEDDGVEKETIESVTTRVERNNRIIQFHFSKPFFPQSTKRGWVVVMEDVTKIARQEQQRRLFVSTVSHELKTPLASVTGYSELLLDWGLDNKNLDEIREDVTRIHDEGKRINAIINNLSFLSQIENNKEKTEMAVYRIDQAVEETCQKYQEVARKNGIQLNYQSLTANMPTVYGNRSMTEQMVGNLITNAVKYSDANTTIWVFIQGHENDVTIKVQDQGRGIPKSQVDKVFNAFFRVDETGSRQAGGSGLGLAIVKMMAEVQEARVALVTRCAEDEETEGQREEVGTDFYITIPTAESVFREALAGVKANAERDEVLYRKATAYMRKINDDVFDLGLNLETLNDPELEQLLYSHLVFIDEIDSECDNISEVQIPENVPQVYEAPIVNAVVEEMPQTKETFETQSVVGTLPLTEEDNVSTESESVIPQKEVDEAVEWVSLQERETKVLVPDPPHLSKPIWNKETIGSQNAEKRRQSRMKHAAGKKKVAKDSTEQENATSRSLLRQVTESTMDRNIESK